MSEKITVHDLQGYDEGAAAWSVGEGIDSNPYSWRETARQNWHIGWIEARRKALDDFFDGWRA